MLLAHERGELTVEVIDRRVCPPLPFPLRGGGDIEDPSRSIRAQNLAVRSLLRRVIGTTA